MSEFQQKKPKLTEMKSLISVFTYCPDDHRKKILHDLLERLQFLREKYEILVLSHSKISDLSYGLIDYFYFDSKNTLIRDFDLTNKFWFRSGNIEVNSSLVYPFSTHLAIYRLLYYSINFSKFMGFNKIHFIEYDINFENFDLIEEVNSDLENHDSVMFNDESGWIWGTYFAAKTKIFQNFDNQYNENFILDTLRNSDTRMTENITPLLLSHEGTEIFKKTIFKINSSGICQKNDEHKNDDLIWCVPLCDLNNDDLLFFIYNEKGFHKKVEVFVDDDYFSFKTNQKGVWTLNKVGNLSNVKKIRILVDSELRNEITLNEENIEKFKKNNFYKISDYEK